MVELVSVTPLDDSDDDAGYASEDWNEECDIGLPRSPTSVEGGANIVI